MDSYSTVDLSWDIPENSGLGKSCQWAELQVGHLALLVTWKEKWSNIESYTNSHAVINGLLKGQGLKRNIIGKCVTKKTWGWGMWIDLSERAKTWRSLYPTWMHTKVWSHQRKILIIKCILWPILWYHSVSFPRHPCHLLKGSWSKWPWWQGWRLYMGSATWTFTHQGWSGYDHHWAPNLLEAETNNEPMYGTII